MLTDPPAGRLMNGVGSRYEARLGRTVSVALTGSVARLTGAGAAVAGLPAPVGAEVRFAPTAGPAVEGVVTGFQDGETFVMPFADLAGVRRGDRVRLVRGTGDLAVGDGLIGRVLDGRGRVIDGRSAPPRPHAADPHAAPPPALGRAPIRQTFDTGVRVVDGLLTVGRGQRIGLFAGSGVGKSTLLAQLARGSEADVSVLVLVGERGREVREFLDHDLGPDGLETQRGRGGHRRRAGRGSPACGPHRHRDRRILPRRRTVRPVDARQRHPARPGPAGNRVGGRRTARHPRLSAQRVRPAPAVARTQRAGRFHRTAPADRSRRSTRRWWTATIRTSRSPTPSAARWTGTSGCRGRWRRRTISPRSTCRAV